MLLCLSTGISGYLDDQKKLDVKLNATNADGGGGRNPDLNYIPGLQTEDRFRLNNLSFAGPVVMGTGGKKEWSRRYVRSTPSSNRVGGMMFTLLPRLVLWQAS